MEEPILAQATDGKRPKPILKCKRASPPHPAEAIGSDLDALSALPPSQGAKITATPFFVARLTLCDIVGLSRENLSLDVFLQTSKPRYTPGAFFLKRSRRVHVGMP